MGYPVCVDHSTSIRHVKAAPAIPLVASPLAYKHSAIIVHAASVAVSEEKSVMMHRKFTRCHVHSCNARVLEGVCVFEDIIPLALSDLP